MDERKGYRLLPNLENHKCFETPLFKLNLRPLVYSNPYHADGK